MPSYLFHPKPEKAHFGPTCGSRYPEETKTDTLRRILRWLHILAPPPPPDTSISWYEEELPLSKIQRAAPLLVFIAGSEYDPDSTSIELKASELARLHELRALLWAICPDPWVGRWTFLNPGLSRMPWYSTVVSQASSGAIVADIGCGVGLDLRQLANDADVTPGKLYAVDSRPAIWDIGEKLFGVDERIKFLTADVVDQLADTKLGSLKGKVDIVVACHLLDQSQYPDHMDTLQRLAELSHIGTRVVGYTLGATGKEVTARSIFENDYGYRFCHDPRSLKMAWGCIAERTETKWEFESCEMIKLEEVGWDREDLKYAKVFDLKALHFIITRRE
jgi:hypothetical protein